MRFVIKIKKYSSDIPTDKSIIDFWTLITNLIHDQKLET